jgi:RNA polymerase sigma factor for flagellar operon FliA
LDELSEFGDVRRSSEPSRLTNQKNQMNMGPSESVEGVMFEEALSEAMTKLPERERLIMALYYDEEMNLKEIGSILGVSESRICQIQGQAAKRLRANLNGWEDQIAV